ncbi:hypothetical protein GJ496_001209 [Pomphorhynchus laevis]|nr:hypothetical protein GJ496_001209 [Pomphorhynchus laevis]
MYGNISAKKCSVSKILCDGASKRNSNNDSNFYSISTLETETNKQLMCTKNRVFSPSTRDSQRPDSYLDHSNSDHNSDNEDYTKNDHSYSYHNSDTKNDYICKLEDQYEHEYCEKSTDIKHFQPRKNQIDNIVDQLYRNLTFSEQFHKNASGKASHNKDRCKDRKNRATVGLCIDMRTRVMLHSLLYKKDTVVEELMGCLSTGKESQVFLAIGSLGDLAIKVYYTSVLKFKSREHYIVGEYRFRRGRNMRNPRKMARTWAEKEFRNLNRLHQAMIPCPMPIILKNHILVMKLITDDNNSPAPLLHDIDSRSNEKVDFNDLYFQACVIIWRMFNEASLVHGDFSEYNLILSSQQRLVVIDVSQSVTLEHPASLVFLRRDCANLNNYFRCRVNRFVDVKSLFFWITEAQWKNWTLDEAKSEFGKLLIDVSQTDDSAFLSVYIPPTLKQLAELGRENCDDYCAKMCGLQTNTVQDHNQSSNSLRSTQSRDVSLSVEDLRKVSKSTTVRQRNESPNSKKARKNAVKEEQREKRSHKLKKHVKKRMITISKRNQ